MAELAVLSTIALKGAVDALHLAFTRLSGVTMNTSFDATGPLVSRVRAGARADISVLGKEGIRELVRDGILSATSKFDLADSFVGLAVKHGAPRPEIGSVDALRGTLLNAKSVAYSMGASGIYFAQLLAQMGIADQINAKATVVRFGSAAELAARGDVEVAIQQVCELVAVPGIDMVGRLPNPQLITTFSTAAFVTSAHRDLVRQWSSYVTSSAGAKILRANGLEVPETRAEITGP